MRTDIIIVGAGIGGLTLALCLHRAGIACRIYESAPQFRPLGVGINILPHASRELARLGLEAALDARAVLTREAVFFNRFGQLIYREPLGRYAGYDDPQYLDPPRRAAATCCSMPCASAWAPTRRHRLARAPASSRTPTAPPRTFDATTDGAAAAARAPRSSPATACTRSSASSCIRDEGAAAVLRRQHVARRHASGRRSSPARA